MVTAPPDARHLGHDGAAVRGNLGDREAEASEPGDVGAARIGEVAARHLAGALEQVADSGGPADPRPVVGGPAEGVPDRPDEQRRVRGAAGDHHPGTLPQRVDDRRGADVGVGRNEGVAQRFDRLPRLVDREPPAGDDVQHVVAGDGRDRQAGEAELARH